MNHQPTGYHSEKQKHSDGVQSDGETQSGRSDMRELLVGRAQRDTASSGERRRQTERTPRDHQAQQMKGNHTYSWTEGPFRKAKERHVRESAETMSVVAPHCWADRVRPIQTQREDESVPNELWLECELIGETTRKSKAHSLRNLEIKKEWRDGEGGSGTGRLIGGRK